MQNSSIKRICVKLKNENIYGIIFKSRRILVINLNFKGTYDVIYFHE